LNVAVQAQAEAHIKTKVQHRKHTTSREVAVAITNTSFSSRKINVVVHIEAPLHVVWESLTDYDNLGTFIPSLVENKCLQRKPQGCLLYQVGAQDVAMGIKFSAACTLDIKEYPHGIPSNMCAVDGNWDSKFPCPSSSSITSCAAGDDQGMKDISFSLVEGDFQAFKGIWRMQPAAVDPLATVLKYSLFVKPHPWLPVGLIQNRISSEVVNNLKAVRQHAEQVHRQLKQQQHASPATYSSNSSASTFSSSVGTDTDEGMPR
jgi:hypothetical protein